MKPRSANLRGAERTRLRFREAIRAGRARSNAGDGGRFDVVLLSLRELLR